MQYTIIINQVGIVRAGLHKATDCTDWAIINYISQWQPRRSKRIVINEKEYTWLNYKNFIEKMPLLSLDKPLLSRRVRKLEKLGLIEKYKSPDNTLYVRLTDKCLEVNDYSEINDNQKVLPESIHCCPETTGCCPDETAPSSISVSSKKETQTELDKNSIKDYNKKMITKIKEKNITVTKLQNFINLLYSNLGITEGILHSLDTVTRRSMLKMIKILHNEEGLSDKDIYSIIEYAFNNWLYLKKHERFTNIYSRGKIKHNSPNFGDFYNCYRTIVWVWRKMPNPPKISNDELKSTKRKGDTLIFKPRKEV